MTRPILIDYDPKPIPVRRFDYVAARAGRDECHVGYGATEAEAIADLLDREAEAQDEAEARAALAGTK
jgi:hypothetical protein